MTMTISYQPTAADDRAYRQFRLWTQPTAWVAPLALVVAPIALAPLRRRGARWIALGALPLATALLLVTERRRGGQRRRQPLTDTRVTVDEHGFTRDDGYAYEPFAWDEVREVARSHDHVFIVPRAGAASAIPVRAFDNDARAAEFFLTAWRLWTAGRDRAAASAPVAKAA